VIKDRNHGGHGGAQRIHRLASDILCVPLCPLWLALLVLLLAPGLFAQNLKLEKTIPLSDDAVVQFTAVSPRGDFIAGACEDGRVRLWSYPSGALQQALDLKDEHVSGLWFSGDGSLLVAGGSRGGIRVWSLPAAKLITEFSVGARINALAISPDRKLIAVAPPEKPGQLWDLTTGRIISELAAKFAGSLALAFAPDGTRLASADADTEIRSYEAQTGAIRFTNSDFLLETFAIAYSADGKSLFVGGADKTITALDAASGKVVRAFPKQKFVVADLRVARDGKSLAAMYFDENSFRNPAPVLLWDVAAQTVRSTILQPDVTPIGGEFVPDGRLLITSTSGGKLQVWSAR